MTYMQLFYSNTYFKILSDDRSIKFIFDFRQDNNDFQFKEYSISYNEKSKLKELLSLLNGDGRAVLYIDNLRLQYDSGFIQFQVGDHIRYILRFYISLKDVEIDTFINKINILVECTNN